jgi:16S rRNA G966 N2-methylase RsmD
VKISIAELSLDPRNARKHSQRNLEAIAASLEKFGQRKPIVVHRGVVLAGNGTLEAAKTLGWTEIDVAEVPDDWDNDTAKAYALADNRTAELAEWDESELAKQLLELVDAEWNITELGFEVPPLADIDGDKDEDEVPEPPVEPKTKLGDIYQLGRHRLMCGDSLDEASVNRLTANAKIDMVFTDPPYGISHSGKGISAPTKSGHMVEGNDFGEILGDGDVNVAIGSFELCQKLYPESRLIFWGANYYPSALPNGHGWLVWDKERVGDTFSGAELAFVNGGVRLDVFRHMWHGIAKASEHGQQRIHPTQKPVALAEWCFNRYGNPQFVLDIFGGSGSTLIAAENTNRTCYMIELDPKYCDVIVTRWENLTGLKAELVTVSN